MVRTPLFAALLALVALISGSTARAATLDDWKASLIAEINKARAAGANCGGRWRPSAAPLTRENDLGRAAQAHADDMHRFNYFSHDSKNHQSAFERVAMSGYTFAKVGEAIAAGVSEPAKVVALWLRNASSCDAVMDGHFRDVGLGLAFDRGAKLKVWWVANFGKKSL